MENSLNKVLNRPEPENLASPDPENEAEDINSDPPSPAEVRTAIKALKNNKVPVLDNITAEILKADLDLSNKVLTDLFQKIWSQEAIPDDWQKGIIMKLPKKGDLSYCANWKGSTLLSVPSKVLCRVILGRIDDTVNQKLREEQAGFKSRQRVH